MNSAYAYGSQRFWLLLVGSFFLAQMLPAEEKFTYEDKNQVRALMQEWRKAKDGAPERSEIAAKVLEFGAGGAEYLLKDVEKELGKAENSYLRDLEKAAKKAYDKPGKSEKEEVAQHRQTLAQLRAKGKGLGKEEVVTKGDPALARLRELLLLDPRTLIEGDEDMKKDRERLCTLGEWRDRSLACIAAQDEKKDADAAPRAKGAFKDILTRKELLVVLGATFVSTADVKVLKENEDIADEIDSLEALGVFDLNMIRLIAGIRPLRIDPRLCAAARDHANDMRTKNFFSHDSPVPGKRSFTDRAKNFKTSASGENIAYGKPTPIETNQQWWHSPGHHCNMMREKYKVIGYGRSQTHWVQMFR